MSEYEEDRRIEGAQIIPKPQREKYIPAELMRLEKHVAALQERLAELTTRLDPILSAKNALAGPEPGMDAKAAQEKSLPSLAASLHQQNDRLFCALTRVDYLIQSLEI